MSAGNIIGGALAGLTVLLAAASLAWMPDDPSRLNLHARSFPPSAGHMLGTDELGRDVMSRVMAGAQPACLAGLAGAVAGLALGALVGARRAGSLIGAAVIGFGAGVAVLTQIGMTGLMPATRPEWGAMTVSLGEHGDPEGWQLLAVYGCLVVSIGGAVLAGVGLVAQRRRPR